jgi:hypothetical protein
MTDEDDLAGDRPQQRHQRRGVGLDPEKRIGGDDVGAVAVDTFGDLVPGCGVHKCAVHKDDRRLVGLGGSDILPEHPMLFVDPGNPHIRLLGVTRRERLNRVCARSLEAAWT